MIGNCLTTQYTTTCEATLSSFEIESPVLLAKLSQTCTRKANGCRVSTLVAVQNAYKAWRGARTVVREMQPHKKTKHTAQFSVQMHLQPWDWKSLSGAPRWCNEGMQQWRRVNWSESCDGSRLSSPGRLSGDGRFSSAKVYISACELNSTIILKQTSGSQHMLRYFFVGI